MLKQQNRAPAMAVGEPAPDRREQELHRREGGNDDADDQALGPNGLDAIRHQVFAIERHQRHHDPETDQVNEDGQKDNQNEGFLMASEAARHSRQLSNDMRESSRTGASQVTVAAGAMRRIIRDRRACPS